MHSVDIDATLLITHMNKSYLSSLLLYLVPSLFSPANAAVIDFETVPGGTPSDQLAISTQYQADYGVTFLLQGGGTPFLEKTGAGDSGHGFWNAAAQTFDTEAAEHAGGLGDYFLRFGTTTFSTAPGPVLVIAYGTPVSAASAQIWDIDAAPNGADGFERWKITARDAAGTVIDAIDSPAGINENLPASLNAKPWTWSFRHANNDIHSIAIEFTGTASRVGLAFDNFSPATAAVPIPAAAWLFATGLVGLIGISRRKADS